MCWNETISLNTFIFSIATLVFIYYNNTYTKYKIKEFIRLPWLYLFLLSIALMQFVEYFLWTSIKQKDKASNHIWSMIGFVVLLIQPFFASLLIKHSWQPMITSIYGIIALVIGIHKTIGHRDKFSTSVSSKGNLKWDWYNNYPFDFIFYITYFVVGTIGLLYLPLEIFVFFGATLLYSVVKYWSNEKTWASNWCWSINLIMIYYLVKLLFILPFYDYKALC